MRRHAAVVLLAGAVLLSSGTASAQFVQQGPKLVGTGSSGGDSQQGRGVAISSDGNTAIVGGPHDNNNIGAAWIFVRSGTTWTQQGSKLIGTGASGMSSQGLAVAISADGSTALIGGLTDNSDLGAAWVFTRTGTTWSQQGPKLVGTGAVGAANQGSAVALSADGNTALVGGPHDDAGVGAVWVFTRSGSTWTQQGSKLVGTGAALIPSQGIAVALSADGNTAIVGGSTDDGTKGAAWVFARSGSTWTQQGAKLTGSGAAGAAGFGDGVALSADGNTAAFGGTGDDSALGAVWIFTRSGTTWTQQGSKLVGTGSSGSPVNQGLAVSLSSNGNLLFEGGYGDGGGLLPTGASWPFVRSGVAWSQFGSKLVGIGAVDGSTGAQQGYSVCLSSDGLTAIVGGYRDNNYAGAVWIFVRTVPALPQHATGDFDGDGRTEATIVKTNGDWASLKSTSAFTASSVVNWSAPGYSAVRGDFDGDGLQDPALYNPMTGNWLILESGSNYTASISVDWGGAGYTPVPGDYDGDGKADPAVYNISTGAWLIRKSSTAYATVMTVTYGGPGYIPVSGQDFDGDTIADVAVYQQSTGVWSVLKSSTAFVTGFSVSWGGPGYTLVPGDYDGDRKADLGVYQRATGRWFILKSSSGFSSTINASWGGVGYLPVPGDYDGDGKFDLGIYQPSTGNWNVLLAAVNFTTTQTITGWGDAGDAPVSTAVAVGASDLLRAGDFDGDGRSEITVYNSTSGLWESLTSSSGYVGATVANWGGAGYVRAPGDYDGDGKTDVGVYQQATGYWYVLLSSTNFTTALSKSAGGTGWTPVPGDYDGDGRTDIMVYEFSTGQWFGLMSRTNFATPFSFSFGGPGYSPVTADFDGDGRTDIGVYFNATGDWTVLLSSTNYTTSLTASVGGSGYSPVAADYDGDGRADFIVYGSNGLWFGFESGSNYTTTLSVSWGGGSYLPVKGDYDGDGRADLATYVESAGAWYILLSGSEYTTAITKNLGGSDYLPVPRYP